MEKIMLGLRSVLPEYICKKLHKSVPLSLHNTNNINKLHKYINLYVQRWFKLIEICMYRNLYLSNLNYNFYC